MNQGTRKEWQESFERNHNELIEEHERAMFRLLKQGSGGRWYPEGREWDEFTCGESVELLVTSVQVLRGFRFEAVDGEYYITNGHFQFFPFQVFARRPERSR